MGRGDTIVTLLFHSVHLLQLVASLDVDVNNLIILVLIEASRVLLALLFQRLDVPGG